jgi:hypothetical protein
MRITFVLESFFPSHRGGTEVYVLNLCRYFKSKEWEVSVLIATTEDTTDYNYEDIPIYTFNIPKKSNSKELNGLIKPRGVLAQRFTDFEYLILDDCSIDSIKNGNQSNKD